MLMTSLDSDELDRMRMAQALSFFAVFFLPGAGGASFLLQEKTKSEPASSTASSTLSARP
jgi:hypothetical protein